MPPPEQTSMASANDSSEKSVLHEEEKKTHDKENDSDLKSEKPKSNSSKDSKKATETKSSPPGSVTSFEEDLMFRCPDFGDEAFHLHELQLKFREQLKELKESDGILAAILTIKSLNPDIAAEQCVSVLEKYLRNIIEHPNVDKYRCIRLGNQIFNEKVVQVEGGLDFLLAIGFKTAVGGDDNQEPYLVYSPTETIDLEAIVKSLKSVTGFELELDRNMKIMYPEDTGQKEVTDEFYDWTPREIRKEQKSRTEEMEKNSQLRRKSKKSDVGKSACRYTRIRVKFPDGVMVEAVFAVKEKLYSLKTSLQSKFYFYDNFRFMLLPTRVFDVLDEEKTFAALELFPNVLLMLKWETNSPGEKYVLKDKS